MNNIESESEKKLLDVPLMVSSEVHFDDDPDGSKKWNTVGRGTLGSVYAGICRNHRVVIKMLDNINETIKHQLTSDARIQYSVQSAYIVSLMGLMEKDGHISIIEERMETTLRQYLKDKAALTWAERYRIAYEIAQGLDVLHSQSIIHKNLTSRNVLLNAQDHVKLGDVGLLVQRSSFHTSAYKSPELHKQELNDLDSNDSDEECKESEDVPSHTFASDVYAYGVLLWELATGKTPFYGKNGIQIHQRIVRGKHEKIPKDCPEAYAQIIKDCWQPNPPDRPNIKSLIERIQGLYDASYTRQFDPSLRIPVEQSYGVQSAYESILPPEGLPDIQKVFHAYQLGPVPGYDIAKVEVINNPDLAKAFALRMGVLSSRRGNPDFAPTWDQEAKDTPEQKNWRARIVQRFSKWSEPNKDQLNPHIHLLSLWHGTRHDVLSDLFTGGYAKVPKTDSGFFGNGVYSSVEASYAYRRYSKGALIVNWVALGSPYPVIDGDMDKFEGRVNYQNYDAHIVPVRPKDPNNPEEVVYYPCKPNQEATYHEVIVFHDQQCLPRYLVTLQPKLVLGLSQEQIFGQHPDFQSFLQHVSSGNQDEVEALLKKTPGLVLGRGNFTDYQKKTFHGITALQYTLWAVKTQRLVDEKNALQEKERKFSKDSGFEKFLEHVAHGNQGEAEALLKKRPEFVLVHGDVTDYSGRTFKRITALQYTMWALDQSMFKMMVPYFEQIQASHVMGDQSIEWRTASQVYLGNPEFLMKSGTDYFDYGPTEKAYKDYLDNWEDLYDSDRAKFKRLGVQIGKQQYHWPAHFALEMTTSDRPFVHLDPVDFSEVGRPSWHETRGAEWFYSKTEVCCDEQTSLASFSIVCRGHAKHCGFVFDSDSFDKSRYGTEDGNDNIVLVSKAIEYDAKVLNGLSGSRVRSMQQLRAYVETATDNLVVKNVGTKI